MSDAKIRIDICGDMGWGWYTMTVRRPWSMIAECYALPKEKCRAEFWGVPAENYRALIWTVER